MVTWNFDASQFDPNKSFELIPVGDHRVRIEQVDETDEEGKPLKSKTTGYEMIKITLSVSGYSSKLYHYVVFIPDRPEITNQNLGFIYDSFGIPQASLNYYEWLGKVGAVRVKHEQYDGKPKAKIAYLLLRSKQENLPPWQEKGDKNFTSVREELLSLKEEEEVNVPF